MKNNYDLPALKIKKINRLKTLLSIENKNFKKVCSSFKRIKKARDGGHFNGYDSPEYNKHLQFYTETKKDCERAIRRLRLKLYNEMLIGNK